MKIRSRFQPNGAPHERRAMLYAALGVLGACLFGTSRASGHRADDFVLIVNPQNSLDHAERALLSDIFLKKITHWPDGKTAHPVDLSPRSAVRSSFSLAVIGRSVAAVRNYWQQRIFSGRDVPPPELDSDDAVMGYVAKYPGAVGYVSNSAKLTEVKAIDMR